MAQQARLPRTVPIRVGDHVRFRLGLREVEGEVVEDRGPIGAQGRKIVRVVVTSPAEESPDPTEAFEIPADDLLLVS